MLEQITDFTRALLSLLPGRVAILDCEGTIVALNSEWAEFVRVVGCSPARAEVGVNYVQLCEQATTVCEAAARRAAAGVRSALGSGACTFRMDYECSLAEGSRWFEMMVLPLPAPQQGAFVIHTEITARKREEAALREAESRYRQSEERYQAIVEAQTELVCRYLPDTTLTFVNGAYCRFFQKTKEELIGRRFIEFIPENIRGWAYDMIDSIMKKKVPITTEHEVVGGGRCVQWIDLPVLDEQGNIIELQSIGRDVTDRRAAEAALHRAHQEMRRLADRLLCAQEQERRRIARELHDDLSQRLAALAVGLSNLRRVLAGQEAATARVERLEGEAIEIADMIRALSHQIHPAILEQLGLPGALRSFVAEFSSRTGIECFASIDQSSADLPADLALSIYRVAQEALNNVSRHANASRISVSLTIGAGSLALEIADDGVGFDPQRSREGWGLGLTSIEERVNSFQGRFSIESQPSKGTRIHLEVPLPVTGPRSVVDLAHATQPTIST